MPEITITDTRTGLTAKFADGFAAFRFMDNWKKKKLPIKQLEYQHEWGVHYTAYDPRIPKDAVEIIERLERIFGSKVPEWHWIHKPTNWYLATGRTKYWKSTMKCYRVVISSNNINPADYIGVVLHEYAHTMTIGHGHNRTFYRQLFRLMWDETIIQDPVLRNQMQKHTLKREYSYKKSSRYWWAEMFNATEILEEYHRQAAVATRLTPEQKTEMYAAEMFKEFES
jgi:hypothetical protein